MKRFYLFLALAFSVMMSAQEVPPGAPADQSTGQEPNDTPEQKITTQEKPLPLPMRVLSYRILYKDTSKKAILHEGSHANLGDYIAVRVQNLDSLHLLERQAAGSAYITLFLNNIPMNVYPSFPSEGNDELIFLLQRDTASELAWDVFYDYPRKYIEEIPLTVGLDNGRRIPSDVKKFQMAIVDRPMLFLNLALIAVMSIIFIWLSIKTPMLRGSNRPGAPFSLARVQLAFWTVIIMFSFVCIYTITGDLPELRTSSLVLLGISMGTTAAARVIDAPIANNISPSDEKSKGLLYDIISDGTGVSIHRLQMVGWTVIMGFYFVRQAHLYLNIPEINDTMLMLMGVSSATYVGLKVPENRATNNDANAGQNNNQQQVQQPVQQQQAQPVQQQVSNNTGDVNNTSTDMNTGDSGEDLST